MSLHVELSEEARDKQKKETRNSILSAWGISTLLIIFVALIFLFVKIVMPSPIMNEVIVYEVPFVEHNKPTEQVEDQQEQTQTQVDVPPSVLTTTNPAAEISVPAIDIEQSVPEANFTTSYSDDFSIGEDSMSHIGSGGGGFGGQAGGSMLEGFFIDTKLSNTEKPTNLSEKDFLDLLQRYISTGWKDSLFNKFYKSPTKLYISHFYMPKSNADAAPKAFKCPAEVKGSRWVAIYRGMVTAPISGTFRFVGYGDDALVVRFNNENVFDYGWYQLALKANTATPTWQAALKNEKNSSVDLKTQLVRAGINKSPMKFYTYTSTPHWNKTIGGMGVGKEFKVSEGKTYPIEVLISEIPGGSFGMTLLIEDVNRAAKNKDEKTGSPILNLFRTNFGLPDEKTSKDNAPPYSEESLIWVATPYNK